MEKDHEKMQPLEDDELEEATGGEISVPRAVFTCPNCNITYNAGRKCPKCGNWASTPDDSPAFLG